MIDNPSILRVQGTSTKDWIITVSVCIAAVAWGVCGVLATIQRLHDLDLSGWWYVLALIPAVGSYILIVILALPGTHGDNRFGSDDRNAY
jgi:uncharacterized membrane protein YhaH (DUF805 family)